MVDVMVKPVKHSPAALNGGRTAGETTRQAILDMAERMFAERGIQAVSLRALMTGAGTNIAAVHYHFGSKERLVEQVFARRAMRIAEQRDSNLAAIPAGLERNENLRAIIAAFLQPGLLGGGDTEVEAAIFARLRARLPTEMGEAGKQLLSKYFNASSKRFLHALELALPELSPQEVHWRFHAMLGIMVYTMANPGRIQALSDDQCDPSNLRAALDYFVPFIAQIGTVRKDERARRGADALAIQQNIASARQKSGVA